VIKELDLFSGGGPEELCIFIFQYQIYFCACKGEFIDDADKVFFAISYLCGIALDYFEPFINKPNPYHNLDFLEDWSAFMQKLSNIFGLYSPEDNDKDAIIAIYFPNDGKTIDYFICFAKYQNHIHWDERALHKVVKNTIPIHICNELCYSQEDVSSFKGFKRAVLWIYNDYWKRIQENKHKSRMNRFPLHHTFKSPGLDLTRTPGVKERPIPIERLLNSPLFPGALSVTLPQRGPNSKILGADSQLTLAKQQCCMSLGLCLHCGQSGHLARSCPRPSTRPSSSLRACTAQLKIPVESTDVSD